MDEHETLRGDERTLEDIARRLKEMQVELSARAPLLDGGPAGEEPRPAGSG